MKDKTRKEMETKVLYRDPGGWLALAERDGMIFSREIRCGGIMVAVIGVRHLDTDNPEVLGRFEVNPAHAPNIQLCSLTGGAEKGEAAKVGAKRELKEESGYEADLEEFVYLGYVRPSKSADTIVHLFGVDLTGKGEPEYAPEGDGTTGEANTYCQWKDPNVALFSKDPILAVGAFRALRLMGGK